MPTALSATIANGTVRFVREVEAVPTTSETTGNVTVNNMGSDGVPAHYLVGFMVSADMAEGSIGGFNAFHIETIVPIGSDHAPWKRRCKSLPL